MDTTSMLAPEDRRTMKTLSVNNNTNNAANGQQLSVRAGMRNSEPTMLSFVLAVPKGSRGQCNASQGASARSSVLRRGQGECCWRLHNSRSLKYRLCGDLICAVTILPGSLAVVVLTASYLNGEPAPQEPYPWLKYVMAGLGCLLLALCLAWMATAVCVYRKALSRRRSNEFVSRVLDVEKGKGNDDDEDEEGDDEGEDDDDDDDKDYEEEEEEDAEDADGELEVVTDDRLISTPRQGMISIVVTPPT